MTPDTILIMKAELKATAADIHDVREIIGIYNSQVEFLRRYPQHIHAVQCHWWSTFILSKYIDGQGSIKDLRRIYPIPKEEKDLSA